MSTKSKNIAIIGGGASGIFAAIRCAQVARESSIAVNVKVFESASHLLKKVKISGGGRCNVTHHIFDTKAFCANYPRGSKELKSPFQQFQASDTVDWFKSRDVSLKYEKDGRMFPVTDSSETIIDCFLNECRKYKVEILTNKPVKNLLKNEDCKYELNFKDESSFIADSVLIATGSSPGGYRLAKDLGHSITDLAPSLFTFKINDELISGLSGTSFVESNLKLVIAGAKTFKQTGPLLITHWGLSGPALLKLSAWAARELKHSSYKGKIIVNWMGTKSLANIEELLNQIKKKDKNSFVMNVYPQELTKRFWMSLLAKIKLNSEKRWAELSNKELRGLVTALYSTEFEIAGKNRFKEEFVECGGVDLKQVNFKTMESKICSGLYFSGEILDIDGITGGFNFQHAWTSGWIAGSHMPLN